MDESLFAQIQIIQFLGFYLHAGIVTLNGKVTGFEFGIIIRHHQLVIDPKLNVLADGPDAITKPFAVLGEQFGGFSSRLAGCHSRIPEMVKVAKSIKAHGDGMVAYLETRLTNAGAEAMNGIIQTAKRKARGFRSFLYCQRIIYLVGSKLKSELPIPVPTCPPQTT